MDCYEALRHAIKAHGGTPDKCGVPYIYHPIAVAEAIERTIWPGKGLVHINGAVVALVHDVWEDTSYLIPPEDLTPEQYTALDALTQRPGEEYFAYIQRIIAAGTLAIVVKLADLWHNLQPERQDCLPEREHIGLEKRYLKTRQMLWDALGYEWWPKA